MQEKLLEEIEEVQAKIDVLSKKPKEISFSLLHLIVGLFFYVIFLVSLTQNTLLFKSTAILSFSIVIIALCRVIADIFLFLKKDLFHYLLVTIFLLCVAVGYIALYEFTISAIILYVNFLIGTLLVFTTLFYLLHVYLGYIKNMRTKPFYITGLSILCTWLLLIVQLLYQRAITLFLLLVIFAVTLKILGDMIAQFKEKLISS